MVVFVQPAFPSFLAASIALQQVFACHVKVVIISQEIHVTHAAVSLGVLIAQVRLLATSVATPTT